MDSNDYKYCPYCGKQIKVQAIKCKHCKSFLSEGDNVCNSGLKQQRQGSARGLGYEERNLLEKNSYCCGCGTVIEGNAFYCPNCGRYLDKQTGVSGKPGMTGMLNPIKPGPLRRISCPMCDADVRVGMNLLIMFLYSRYRQSLLLSLASYY